MENLIILAIIWAIFRALSNRARGRMNQPVPEDEEPRTYRLPPDLKGKWGPKDEEGTLRKNPRPVEPEIYDILDDLPETEKVPIREEPPLKRETPVVTMREMREIPTTRPTPVIPEKKAAGQHECIDLNNMGPGMLKQGIILSEVLGPPVARRKKNRYQ